ncbi:hypothetical protein AHAS_AhasUnG0001900 [Arachis hypogaea]
MYGLMRLLRNIYSWVGQALLFWFMVSLGSMVHPGGEIELQEIVNGLINTQIFPQPLLINGLLTYTKECGSFDKFLPLYLFLRCLDFSKLHGHAEEKCYSHSDQDITLLVQITIKVKQSQEQRIPL